jgi:hypothetical protein
MKVEGLDASHGHASPTKVSPLRRVVLGLVAIVGLSLFAGGGFCVYAGAVGPEATAYPGNLVPKRFITVMQEVGALEEGEQIDFFYSDGLTDIRDGFYFVSDRKVVLYGEEFGLTPLTAVPFQEIADARLIRDTSFLEDSEIVLALHDGRMLLFPVSSDRDRDILFHEAIVRRLPRQ